MIGNRKNRKRNENKEGIWGWKMEQRMKLLSRTCEWNVEAEEENEKRKEERKEKK